MVNRNETDTSRISTEKQNDSTEKYIRPIDNNIDPVDSPIYDDNESLTCPFDTYRLGNNDDPMTYDYSSNRPIQPGPYPPRPIRPHPQPLPYPPRPIRPQPIWPEPWPYPPNVHYIIHQHHHFYHNRPHDGNW